MSLPEHLKVISLGWGVQSWTLAAMSALGELPPVDFAIHSDTTWEREETYKFAKQWTAWLEERGVKVLTVRDEWAAKQIIDDTSRTYSPLYTLNQKGAGGQLRRSCTQRWKIAPMRRYISTVLADRKIAKDQGAVEQWIGITSDEWYRAKDSDVDFVKNVFPLLDKGMSRSNCLTWLASKGLPSPGKSACVFCPYHTNKTWEHLKRGGGPDWQTALRVDGAIRNKRPNFQSFVHQERIPLEAIIIPEDKGYTQLQLLEVNDKDAECDSGYCFL